MQPEQTSEVGETLDAGTVARFLRANPDFFDRHRDILPRLHIPHPSGRAVSLIERQVSVLREKCTTLESHLRDLIGVARANERLQRRLHALVGEIVSADSLETLVAATRRSLLESFGADAVHVLLVGARDESVGDDGDASAVTEGSGYRGVAADDPCLSRFAEMLAAGGTRCGLPDAAQLEAFVGARSAEIGSAALVPLVHERPLGLVMLASRDESRFAAGKGVVFLDQLGDVLGRRVHALGREPCAGAPPAPEASLAGALP